MKENFFYAHQAQKFSKNQKNEENFLHPNFGHFCKLLRSRAYLNIHQEDALRLNKVVSNIFSMIGHQARKKFENMYFIQKFFFEKNSARSENTALKMCLLSQNSRNMLLYIS